MDLKESAPQTKEQVSQAAGALRGCCNCTTLLKTAVNTTSPAAMHLLAQIGKQFLLWSNIRLTVHSCLVHRMLSWLALARALQT